MNHPIDRARRGARSASFLFLGAVALMPLLPAAAQDAHTPPNIVLMVTDDQGLQAGCYGDRIVRTPALDRLAA